MLRPDANPDEPGHQDTNEKGEAANEKAETVTGQRSVYGMIAFYSTSWVVRQNG